MTRYSVGFDLDMRVNDITLFTLIKAKAPMMKIIGAFLICKMKVHLG